MPTPPRKPVLPNVVLACVLAVMLAVSYVLSFGATYCCTARGVMIGDGTPVAMYGRSTRRCAGGVSAIFRAANGFTSTRHGAILAVVVSTDRGNSRSTLVSADGQKVSLRPFAPCHVALGCDLLAPP
jgi:hypothetical protein